MTRAERVELLRGTALECWNVLRAQHGHDPYGMTLKDRPWPEIVRRTYSSHLSVIRARRAQPTAA